ncbi:MAG: hypothetical protein ABID09_01525 [Candidatus Omnitrophota bacterium]
MSKYYDTIKNVRRGDLTIDRTQPEARAEREQDPNVGAGRRSRKIAGYRIFGWLAIIYGLYSYVVDVTEFDKLAAVLHNPLQEFMPALYGCLPLLAVNIYLWMGLACQWRADINEKPGARSVWANALRLYSVFAAAIALWMLGSLFM